MKKGISLISLSTIIIVMIIIASVVVVNVFSSIEEARKTQFAVEILNIQEAVNRYYDNTSSYPVKNAVSISVSGLSESSLLQFAGETISGNKASLSTIDMTLIGMEDLSLGNNSDPTDVYAVSTETGRVYYLKGIKYKSEIYYTHNENLLSGVKVPINLAYNEINRQGIIFTLSKINYTNQPIQVGVRVPKTYTNIQITSAKSVSTGNVNGEYTEYTVNATSADKNGNYTIKVEFSIGTVTKTVNYYVKNYDAQAPSITVGDIYLRQNEDGTTAKILSNINITDELSGIKEMKYELGTITDTLYFVSNGKNITDKVINLNSDGKYTIYAIDKAGNVALVNN